MLVYQRVSKQMWHWHFCHGTLYTGNSSSGLPLSSVEVPLGAKTAILKNLIGGGICATCWICGWRFAAVNGVLLGPCLGDVSRTYSVEISQCGCHFHERITVELYRILVFRVRGSFERFVSDVWLFFHEGMVLENFGLKEGIDEILQEKTLSGMPWKRAGKGQSGQSHPSSKMSPNDPTPRQRFRGA